ncbi:hypothetical protein ISN44_As06g040490 [Arabidopsis suecica]|uniref:Uncharacterized protein n=1 Tax=Arabidopsis suecica TaxID=45249 RepID=A0A8T2CQI8_ARASU|nr:hypothetical protein ISN44_As06g040490 [Arabidopsis suecica]
MSKCCSVFDDFGLEKVRQGLICPVSTVYFAHVCGSTLDSHHGFVAECGPSRDVDLGFHVDDSQVTLNVSLGKQSVGGELYFQGASYNNIGKRYDAKSEARSSPYVTITLKTMFEPLYRELYTFDPTFFFTPSFLKAINGDTVESFASVVSVSSPGIFVSEMLQPKFYEMMLSKCSRKCVDQNRDIDLGFHVDDSELTSNVSMSKHFEFRGTRCKKHDVNTDTKPEEMFGDSHTPDQAVLRHGDRATTSGHGVDMILWSTS